MCWDYLFISALGKQYYSMKILFIDTTHPILRKKLEERGHHCDTACNKKKSEIETIINQYDGLIIRSRINIDQTLIDKATNLKFIARAGSGLENIDTSYAEKKSIKCFNAPEGNRQSVAEHSIAMLLSLFNNLKYCDAEIREGKWIREANRGIELSGKTIGIIGYGNNGSAFAEILKGFGVKILAYDKYLEKYPFQTDMQTIYKNAEILSLHIPLTEETTYLVNHDFINRFEKRIYLINTARGKCVKTSALVSALKCGKIIGACLDVLEHEKRSFENLKNKMQSNNMKYLISSNKVILSPHVAGWTKESKLKIANVLLKKIISDFP